jgi:ABC-2 type transport system permease protein
MITAIALKELKKLRKAKGTYFWTFVLPILFIMVFAMIFNQSSYTFSIHYIDESRSDASKQFIERISHIDSFKMVKESSKKDALDQIKKGKMANFLYIPDFFESKPMIEYYYDENSSSSQETGPVKTLLENIVNESSKQKISAFIEANASSKTEADNIMTPPVNILQKGISAQSVNPITQIVPGYTVMFAFFIIITMARNFIADRDSGMLSRLYSTRMNRFHYTVGMWFPSILLVLIQITVLLGFGHMVYDLHLGNILSVVALSIVLTLVATSLGLAISFLAKSEQVAMGITQLITLGGAVLGGLWFPIDIMPKFVQNIAHFVPQYWAQKGFIDIMSRNASISDILPNIGILLLFVILAFFLAILGFKRFFRDAIH